MWYPNIIYVFMKSLYIIFRTVKSVNDERGRSDLDYGCFVLLNEFYDEKPLMVIFYFIKIKKSITLFRDTYRG